MQLILGKCSVYCEWVPCRTVTGIAPRTAASGTDCPSSHYRVSFNWLLLNVDSAESSSKAHKNGASAYARHHQGKVHSTGKVLASKLTVNGKMSRLDCNSMYYFEGADTGLGEGHTPEMVSCHSSKMVSALFIFEFFPYFIVCFFFI